MSHFLLLQLILYLLFPDGVYNESTITVYNSGRVGSPDGEVSDINGYAYTTNETGKLLVDFGFPVLGNCEVFFMFNLFIYFLIYCKSRKERSVKIVRAFKVTKNYHIVLILVFNL